MLKITKVKKNSIAKELGLEKGDCIIAFDGFVCEDELDYLYYQQAETFTVTVRNRRTNEELILPVEKAEGEDLGLEFEKICTLKTCHNRCLFCFVDQMPKGLRESLYVKDDDYTMSFTCGNFVTLTNLSEEGLQRIARLKLSPLYISVHTTNPKLRIKLLRNRFAGKILEQIQTLANAGIEMHCQAVIVPNENDGAELERTARDLFKLYPYVKDLACVPTGLTKYRAGLHFIPDVDKQYSEALLNQVDQLNQEFGVNFVLPADEYFVKAGREMKESAFYGDFSQIENGIGLTRKFLDEAYEALNTLPLTDGRYALSTPKKCLMVCGVSATQTNAQLILDIQNKINGLTLEILTVENDFFGHSVTCTGLLTGRDILSALKNYQKTKGDFDEVLIAGSCLKEFEDVFLCGMQLKTLEKALKNKKILINRDGGKGLIDLLVKQVKTRRKK